MLKHSHYPLYTPSTQVSFFHFILLGFVCAIHISNAFFFFRSFFLAGWFVRQHQFWLNINRFANKPHAHAYVYSFVTTNVIQNPQRDRKLRFHSKIGACVCVIFSHSPNSDRESRLTMIYFQINAEYRSGTEISKEEKSYNIANWSKTATTKNESLIVHDSIHEIHAFLTLKVLSLTIHQNKLIVICQTSVKLNEFGISHCTNNLYFLFFLFSAGG